MKRRFGIPIEFLSKQFYFVLVQEHTTCSIHRNRERDVSYPAIERCLFPRTPGINFVSLEEHVQSSTEVVLERWQTIRFNAFVTRFLEVSKAPSPQGETSRDRQFSSGNGHNVYYFFLRRRHLRQEIQIIHLICRWRLLYLQLPPHEALAPFQHLPYIFSSFLRPSESLRLPPLSISLAGIAKGREMELLGPVNGAGSSWNETAAQSQDERNLWVISHRFVVCSRNLIRAKSNCGEESPDAQLAELQDMTVALERRKVSLVVTLSNAGTFADCGLEVLDISATSASSSTSVCNDKGDTLSNEIQMRRFLQVCESTRGPIAVNVSNSLDWNLAAACIGCYLMKHSKFTAQEAIGWLCFCLPLEISMAWEVFLGRMQSQMWLEGERYRKGDSTHDLDEPSSSHSMHINISETILGHLSLVGSNDRHKRSSDSLVPLGSCVPSQYQESHQSPTAKVSSQLKRRPLTQGSINSRRFHRSTDGTSLRADFTLMHKFLHQTPTSAARLTDSSVAISIGTKTDNLLSRPNTSSTQALA